MSESESIISLRSIISPRVPPICSSIKERRVNSQGGPSATRNELNQSSPLLLIERLDDSPESINRLVICVPADMGEFLQIVHIDQLVFSTDKLG